MREINKKNTILVIHEWKVIHRTTKKEFSHLVKITKENNKKLVSKLAFLMQKYAQKIWETPERVKQVFLEKYSITSRKDLNKKQLEEAIDSYKFWLLEQ